MRLLKVSLFERKLPLLKAQFNKVQIWISEIGIEKGLSSYPNHASGVCEIATIRTIQLQPLYEQSDLKIPVVRSKRPLFVDLGI